MISYHCRKISECLVPAVRLYLNLVVAFASHLDPLTLFIVFHFGLLTQAIFWFLEKFKRFLVSRILANTDP